LFANYVAALSVTKMGAQCSMPSKQEVAAFRKKYKASAKLQNSERSAHKEKKDEKVQ